MSAGTRVFVAGACAVLVFDTIGSLASRAFGFDYVLLALGSILIYALVGAAFVRLGGSLSHATIVGMSVGLVDITLGWAISWQIGPGRPVEPEFRTAAMILLGGVSTLLIAAAAAHVGARIARRQSSALKPAV